MVKVLFAGEPSGRFEALFKRVAAVNASNGPFDLLLCCGAFFAGSGEHWAAVFTHGMLCYLPAIMVRYSAHWLSSPRAH